MAASRGGADVRRFIAQLPAELERKVLVGAGRAAAKVIAEEAKERSVSSEVASAIKTKVTSAEGKVIARVQVRGPGAYMAPWLEYGTAPHFISVDDTQRSGRSIGRINKETKTGSLVIGGAYVGDTVFHPGARPHPFLRPALDAKGVTAVKAAQAYINQRVTRSGIVGGTGGGAE